MESNSTHIREKVMVIPLKFTIVARGAREPFGCLNKIKYRQSPKRAPGATFLRPEHAAKLPTFQNG